LRCYSLGGGLDDPNVGQREGNTLKTDIEIVYKYVDDVHCFSSNDERVQGLFVAHKDLWEALLEVE
jgi:hypothetical protein